MRRLGCIASSVLLLLACDGRPNERAVTNAMARAAAAGPGTTIALADHAPSRWDRVCIFGPYTDDDRILDVIGRPVAGVVRSHGLYARDDMELMVFMQGPRVVTSMPLARMFDTALVTKCHARGEAVWTVRAGAVPGWPAIGP